MSGLWIIASWVPISSEQCYDSLTWNYCVMKWNLRPSLNQRPCMETDYFLTQFYNVEINGLGKAARNFRAGIGLWRAHTSCTLPRLRCHFPRSLPEPQPRSCEWQSTGNFFCDFLYNLNTASVWDEHFPISLEREESLFNAYKKIHSCFCGENKFMAGNWNLQKREKFFKACLPVVWGFFLHS